MTNIDTDFVLNPEYVADFVRGGRSLFTIQSENTGVRFTYKVTRAHGTQEQRPYFVSLMTGPDNELSYSYVGVIFPGQGFRWTSKSKVTRDNKGVVAFDWFYNKVLRSDRPVPENLKVLHHGRCGRCNRVLTVPESIESGLGPICAKS